MRLGIRAPVDHLQVEIHFIANRVELRNVEIFHVEEPPQLFPYFAHQVFFVERGAERAADFVEHVQFFGAPRSLLNQVAVFHRHPDLMSQRQEQAEFRGSEASAVRCAQEEHAEGLLFGLEADGHDAAQPLREGQVAETTDGLFFFKSGKGIVAQVAETQAARRGATPG